MNERIKQLYVQAIQYANSVVPKHDRYNDIYYSIVSGKHAELIVKECADAADMAYDARCPFVGDYVVEQMGYAVEGSVADWRTK
jgi:hypothetical protein